jgi:hypothetical protein
LESQPRPRYSHFVVDPPVCARASPTPTPRVSRPICAEPASFVGPPLPPPQVMISAAANSAPAMNPIVFLMSFPFRLRGWRAALSARPSTRLADLISASAVDRVGPGLECAKVSTMRLWSRVGDRRGGVQDAPRLCPPFPASCQGLRRELQRRHTRAPCPVRYRNWVPFGRYDPVSSTYRGPGMSAVEKFGQDLDRIAA